VTKIWTEKNNDDERTNKISNRNSGQIIERLVNIYRWPNRDQRIYSDSVANTPIVARKTFREVAFHLVKNEITMIWFVPF
jgi:hypothetical protein